MLPKLIVSLVFCLIFLNSLNCEKLDLDFAKFLKCDPEKSSSEKSNECPVNSSCIELGKDLDKTEIAVVGLCACKQPLIVNESYNPLSKTSEYCIKSGAANSTSSSPSSSSVSSTISPPTSTLSTNTHTEITPVAEKTTQSLPTKATEISTKSTLTTQAPPMPSTTTQANLKPSNESSITNRTDTDSKRTQSLGGIALPIMLVLAFIGSVYAAKKYDLVERIQTFNRNRRSDGLSHQTRYDGIENDFDDDPLLI